MNNLDFLPEYALISEIVQILVAYPVYGRILLLGSEITASTVQGSEFH